MSVVFKEKHYDQLLLLVNNFLIILLLMFILITGFNLMIKERVDNLKNDLKLLQEEELKYNSLLKNSNRKNELKKVENKKYNLLISLADYADNIIYNSLHFKNNQFKLEAVSGQQNNIFALIEALENDSKFKNVNLIKINQKESYYFELETLIRQ